MTFARYLMGVKRRTRILVIARLVGYLKAYVDDDSKISAIYLKKKCFGSQTKFFRPRYLPVRTYPSYGCDLVTSIFPFFLRSSFLSLYLP